MTTALHTPAIAQLYQSILDTGQAGAEQFYTALRSLGIDPTPDPVHDSPNLYATNPVIVPGTLVQAIVRDANTFCQVLRAQVPDGATLLIRAPADVQTHWASREVAEQLVLNLREAHPFTSMDAFLVETSAGLGYAYLEWQTVGSYLSLGLRILSRAVGVWPQLAQRATLTATHGLTVDHLADQLRHMYLAGIADDPRQGVIVDYRPHHQPTRQEFYAIQALTGGPKYGMGIVDPRELVITNGRPHYRRDGEYIPVRRIYSRLVYSDLQTLLDAATPDELGAFRHVFGDAEHVTWINHPLHFFYGSKADFPDFWARGLSEALPACWQITPKFIRSEAYALAYAGRLTGYVQKATDMQSGRAVTADPLLSELQSGAILQQRIVPAPYHRTLWGVHTPEIRVMCLPDERGELIAGLIYTRIKAPHVFLSNAGHIAELGIKGTGEGFGVVVFE